MHIFHTGGVGIRVPQDIDRLAQGQEVLLLAGEPAEWELPVQVPQREAVGFQAQLRVGAHAVFQRVDVGLQMAVGPVGIDQIGDPSLFAELMAAVDRDIGRPLGRWVGDAQRLEDLLVEIIGPQQQAVDLPEELARLSALDDAMVVGGGQGGYLADAHLSQAHLTGALEIGGVTDSAHPEDAALPGHQPRNRHTGADSAGVGEADRRAGQVIGNQFALACLANQNLVAGEELGEVEVFAGLDVWHHQGPDALVDHVDCDTQVDTRVFDEDRAASDLFVGAVHARVGLDRLHHGETYYVGETDLATAAAAQEVVDRGPVLDRQFHRYLAHRGCGWNGQGLIHIARGAHLGPFEGNPIGLGHGRSRSIEWIGYLRA